MKLSTVINQGQVEYKGTGVIVSGIQYYPDPLPGVPTLSSEPGSHSSHGRNKAIIGGVIGGIIGFLALVVPAIVMIYRRRRSAKRGEVGEPQLDLLTPGERAIVGQDGEGLTPTPAEKSENTVTTDQMATSTILQNEPEGESVPVVLPQTTQPPSSQGSKPLPPPPSTQLPSPAESHSLGSHIPPAPQLSPQQLRLVQELMDQGLPSSQVAGVVQSMLASGGSRNTDATPLPSETPGHVNDAPPQYDFKDRPANDGM
ncbi:hypothetical protein FRC04_010507 [Tulasnella sp. 424]|nr:hypothetical protein FRC04_010507 [Tulasnella sp. 424]